MPIVTVNLNFDGTAEAAMRFYQSTLGGKLEAMLKFSEMPPGKETMPPGTGDRIAHASLSFGDNQAIMASDTLPGMPYAGIQGIAVALGYDSVEEARRVFAVLSEGGKVTMALEETFWAKAFGMVTDRFGTPWMINAGLKP
jgi:PhnB protein